MKKINIILAIDSENGIGKNNSLAWKLSSDLKYFKKITTSGSKNVVIMGRKTWESIPEKFRPLSDRINCILTKNPSKYQNRKDVMYFDDFDKCLTTFRYEKNINIFLIGGATLYNKYLNHKNLDKIYLTKVKGNFNCDVFFKGIPDNFVIESYTDYLEENNIKFRFEVYKKIG